MNTAEEVLNFWFEDTDQAQWWRKDEAFDASLARRFADLHKRATRCELYTWRETPQGRLAEIIVLDQFSRNMFRDSALAFANDPMALALAQEAIAAGADKPLTAVERSFLYMPFMHSESAAMHEIAVELFTRNGIATNLDFELRHQKIITRFGRYPHRNRVLGRESTAEELEYLATPGAGF